MRTLSDAATLRIKPAFRGLLLAAVVFLAACFSKHEPTDATELSGCYKRQFGAEPPPAVTGLLANEIVVGDTASEWLRFKADSATVNQIIAKGFVASDRDGFRREAGGANMPPWWKPDADGMTRYYIHPQWPSQLSHSVAVLAHDHEKKAVYFQHADF